MYEVTDKNISNDGVKWHGMKLIMEIPGKIKTNKQTNQ